MADLDVSEDTLPSLSSVLRSGASGLDSDVSGLSGSLAATRTQWTGLASDAAAVAHAGWAARMRTQTDYAEQLAAAVDRAVTLYQEAETTPLEPLEDAPAGTTL